MYGQCHRSRLVLTFRSIATQHLCSCPYIHLPLPPEHIRARPTTRTVRSRERHSCHINRLQRQLQLPARCIIHSRRTLCRQTEHRSRWRKHMGMPPPRH